MSTRRIATKNSVGTRQVCKELRKKNEEFVEKDKMQQIIYNEVAHMKTCVDDILGELKLDLNSTFKECSDEVVRINKSNKKLLDEARQILRSFL